MPGKYGTGRRAGKEVTMNVILTVNEIYAIQSIIIGLNGLTRKICQDYKVDNQELLEKLKAVTDAWRKETYENPT